jgi:hypothetical protein
MVSSFFSDDELCLSKPKQHLHVGRKEIMPSHPNGTIEMMKSWISTKKLQPSAIALCLKKWTQL